MLGIMVLAASTVGTYIVAYTVTYAQTTLQLPARTGFIAEVASYFVTTATPAAFTLVLGMALLGGLGNFWCGSFFAGLAEALPQSIRSSGFATVYSVAIAAFGGTTQLGITWLIHVIGSAVAPAWYLVGVTAISQVALMLFPETAPARQGPYSSVAIQRSAPARASAR